MKVGRLSALRIGRLYPQEIFVVLISVKRVSRPQGHSAAGRIIWIRISNDNIGNRSRDLPVCSVVPQPLRHRVPPHPWQYLTGFLLEWKMFQTKAARRTKTHILCHEFFSQKIMQFFRWCGKMWYNRTDHRENIIRRLQFSCWITKATNIHSEYKIPVAFHGDGCANAPHYCVVHIAYLVVISAHVTFLHPIYSL
jgi:hypothetical protein